MILKTPYDKLIYGLLSGFLLPVIIGLTVFLFSSIEITLISYLETLFLADIITHIVSLCVLPNLLIFFIFLHFNMLKAARGVLGITILWAATVFVLKII